MNGFTADDEKLGYMPAGSVVNVLKNQKAIKDEPVKVDPKPKFYMNTKTAQKIGIKIPYYIIEGAPVADSHLL